MKREAMVSVDDQSLVVIIINIENAHRSGNFVTGMIDAEQLVQVVEASKESGVSFDKVI